MRSFASQVWVEPKTIKALELTGWENFQQTKSLDYTQMTNFRSFETEINSQFAIKKTEASTDLTKRTGLIGYKIGMTHFWNKWGKLTPCTVIQVDRCQVTQVKTFEHDGVNAIQVGVGEQYTHKIKKP